MNPRQARQHRALSRLHQQAGVTLSMHAHARRIEHEFSEDEVLLTVASPEQTYTCPAHVYGPDRRTYQRGRLAVIVDEHARVVITVLPRVQERWEHAA